MTSYDQELSHRLKIKFGTAPNEPNARQLELIKSDIRAIHAKGATPTEKQWAEIVKRHCPNAGGYGYAGADNSDLITLLRLATKN